MLVESSRAANVSVRTLQRRLRDEGSSFSRLLDETRFLLCSGYSYFAETPRHAVRWLAEEARRRRVPVGVDPTRASIARVYDAFLGGKDNYAIDRDLGDQIAKEYPIIVDIARVDPSYFDALDAPVRAGRAFREGDGAAGAPVVIVDQGFVDQILQGRNAVGQQRVRRRRRAHVGHECA